MRFLFVDKISKLEGERIEGSRQFLPTEPMQYPAHGGGHEVAPGALSEAIGQLASWLCLEKNHFTARPVFLFADRIQVTRRVPVGTQVDLSAEVQNRNAEGIRFSGEARVAGEIVHQLIGCGGYFVPLEKLEDPVASRAHFEQLRGPGLTLGSASDTVFPFASLAGTTTFLDPRKEIRTQHSFSPTAPFYADHFPRLPVTPIVVINEMFVQATLRLLGLSANAQLRQLGISRIKIRSFVAPGEVCETVVRTVDERVDAGRRLVNTTVELMKEGRRIVRGDYEYEVLA